MPCEIKPVVTPTDAIKLDATTPSDVPKKTKSKNEEKDEITMKVSNGVPREANSRKEGGLSASPHTQPQ
eukprot:4727117-Prymnesium_polylepis.1